MCVYVGEGVRKCVHICDKKSVNLGCVCVCAGVFSHHYTADIYTYKYNVYTYAIDI